MENRVRSLPEWLTNLSEQGSVTKKRGYQKVTTKTHCTKNETARNDKRRRKDEDVTTASAIEEYVKPAKCDKGKVKTSTRVRARRVELSSSEDDSEVPGSAVSGSIKEISDAEDVKDANIMEHDLGITTKLERISGVMNENSEDSNTDFEPPSPSIVESSKVPEISITSDSEPHSVSCMKKLENSDSGSETDFEPSSHSHVQNVKVPEICNDSKSEPRSPSVIQNKNEADADVNNQTDQVDNPISTSTNGNSGRPSCQYGSKCYRKNPQHTQDFSHPGDDDYSTVDNRPECEYGLSCYRKNPLHRQHYKHTKKVQKPRKAKHPKTTSNDDNSVSEEDNDYDFDDPFINDASSDDYEPEGSDSDTDFSDANGSDEDVKQEKKESKRIQWNKKH